MPIPPNGYLGDPVRTTAEFQVGIDDLTEALNDPTTGLDAKAASADVYDKTEVYKKTESDSRYVNTSGDTMTGQLNGITPSSNANLTRKDYVDDRVLNKNWVSKWSGNANSVVNSWGDGEYLVRLDMPSSNDYAFRLTVSGSIKVGISMYFNPYSYGVLYNGSSFVFSNENSGHPIIQIWKAE